MWDEVKEYLAQDEVIEKGQRTFLRNSKLVMPTGRGDHHDLGTVLSRVKDDHGHIFEEVRDPAIVWSRRRTHAKFGYWMEDYNVIVVNRILDHPKVPSCVLDYVVYHELLHKVHGSINLAGARESHFYAFGEDERRFEKREEAEAFLDKVFKSRGKCLK
jgi:hypothetical protein